MKSAEKRGSSWSTATIADFSRRKIEHSVTEAAVAMSISTNAETVKVMDEASTDGSFTIAQTNGQDRRDTRQNCRQANGAVGADKRNCKQTGRQN